MHHALEIPEVLSNIFHNLIPPIDLDGSIDPTLAALARTCRAFKEPALDALWMILPNLYPLSLCLPGTTCQTHKSGSLLHTFNRPLAQTDWNTLRSYTRRIQYVQTFDWSTLWGEFSALLSQPPTTEPLFPNLRYLDCQYDKHTMSLLNLPLPSLTCLDVVFENLESFQASLDSFPKFSPGIKELSLDVEDVRSINSRRIEPNYLCRWQNLSSVTIQQFTLDMDDLVHLSRMPALNQLIFSLNATLPYSDTSLSFSNLQSLVLYSQSLAQISRLLLRIQLPVVTNFLARMGDRPSKNELVSFLAGVQISKASQTLNILRLIQAPFSNGAHPETLVLGFEELQCCMAFGNLVRLELNIACATVHLTDGDLLTSASAWPKLEDLRISSRGCWHSEYGITPGGLVRLWRTCRSLIHVELRLDTRGYTEVPPSEALETLRATLTLPPTVRIYVLDAAIEAETVQAVATFFSGMAACCGSLWLYYKVREQFPNAREYVARWSEVRARAYGPRVYLI